MADLIAVDKHALDQVVKEVAELKAIIQQAHLPPLSDWVSVHEYAKARNISASTVRRMIADGRLESRGAGKTKQVPRP